MTAQNVSMLAFRQHRGGQTVADGFVGQCRVGRHASACVERALQAGSPVIGILIQDDAVFTAIDGELRRRGGKAGEVAGIDGVLTAEPIGS
jgi:hypothetical protein